MIKKISEKFNNFIKGFIICVKNTWTLIITNWKPVVLFAVINVFLSIFGTTFFADQLLNIIYHVNGMHYVAPHNLKQLFLSPVGIICILIFFIVLGIVAIFEISSLLYAFSMSQIGLNISFSSMIAAGTKTCKKVIHPKNWVIILFVIILLPFTGVINLMPSFISVSIPGFINDFIAGNKIYAGLFAIVYIILVIIVLLNIHALNFFVIPENSFITSCKKSKDLMKNNIWSTIIYLTCFSLLFTIILTMFSSTTGSLIVKVFFSFKSSLKELVGQRIMLAEAISTAEEFFRGLIMPLLNLAALATLFYKKIDEQNKFNEFSKDCFTDKKASKLSIVVCIVIGISILCYNFWSIGVRTAAYFDPINEPAIVAHRGDSVYAPENTMPAFKMAALENVDWVEFDVHETKDGVMIVSHDDNLERVSGKKVFVHDLTYAETQELEVGAWFDHEYKGTKLSTLDEVLKLYKDTDIKLQIEIKPTKYDHELEEKVLQVINDNDMHDRCIITSLKTEPLKRIKELDPTMITTYSMFVAWDNIQDIEFADYYTVEEKNIDPFLVYNVHKAGKKIFAWTVNNQSTVQYLTYCNVDGILTDDPLMLWEALTTVDIDNGIGRIIGIAINRMIKGY